MPVLLTGIFVKGHQTYLIPSVREKLQPIYDKIGGDDALSEKEPQIVSDRQEETKQRDLRFRGNVVIAGRYTAAVVAPAGIRTKPNRGLRIQ